MARKQRNNVDYFPHPVDHGKKMFYLRSKFKNDGYTVWFMLLEELGKADYHYLNLSDKVQIMYLSASLMVSEETLREIINTLVEFKEFDKELWEKESILYNEKFIENIEDAYKKRSNECISKNVLLDLLESKGELKHLKSIPKQEKSTLKGDENPQTKLYYSKENKTIVNYNNKTTAKDFKKLLIELGAEENHIDDWFKVRKQKRAAFTATAFTLVINECINNNFSVATAIKTAAENSWSGFKYEWYLNVKPQLATTSNDDNR